MKSSDPENTVSGLLRYKPGRRFYVFIISLFLASGFWVLNALNKTYSEAVTIYIKYINLPENRAFSPIPIDNIKIDLSGDGYSLIQLKNLAEDDTIIVDLQKIEFENEGNKKRAKIASARIVSDLKKELNNNINITRVSRDSIEIIIEQGARKELAIKPNYTISLKKGMVLKRPVYTEPNFTEVTGPLSVLNKLDNLTTELVVFDEISDFTEIEVLLSYNNKSVIPEYKTVKLIAEVEDLTEGEIEVPITIVGVPENKRLRLLPNLVTVKYSTGLSHYDLISQELFDVIVNYEDVIKNASKIPVYLRTVPSYVNVIHFYPEQVGYLKMDISE